MHLTKAATAVESAVVDTLERRVEDEFLQIDALRESTLLQPLERCGQLDLLQHLTLLESTFLDHMNVIHEGDAPELLTIMERTHADAEGRERDIDLLQRQATIEGFVADSIDAIR